MTCTVIFFKINSHCEWLPLICVVTLYFICNIHVGFYSLANVPIVISQRPIDQNQNSKLQARS